MGDRSADPIREKRSTPALVGEEGLIAGHARILAARQLGIAKIPVMVAAGWTEAQTRAYVLADNQSELLRLEFGELKLLSGRGASAILFLPR